MVCRKVLLIPLHQNDTKRPVYEATNFLSFSCNNEYTITSIEGENKHLIDAIQTRLQKNLRYLQRTNLLTTSLWYVYKQTIFLLKLA